MIYSKNISEIVWEDIVDFCNQRVQENSTLDYKKEFPKNLEKTIAAFANTMGGLILIGVDEDDENKPKSPIEGILFDRGLSERVISIILSNITPPLIPEIQVCENADSSRAIVIIRVPQSNKTPHAINKNTEVYIRTGNRNYYELLATVDKLYWLEDNRSKSILLRENTLKEANERFNKFYNGELNSKKTDANYLSSDVCRLTLNISPCYPQELLSSPPALKNILNKISIKDYYGTHEVFPIVENVKLSQHGINSGWFFNNYAYYCEISCFGIYYYRQHIFGRLESPKIPPESAIRFYEIIARIDQFIESSFKLYSTIGFNGLLSFNFIIDGLSKFKLRTGEDYYYDKTTIEDKVSYEDSFLKNQIMEIKRNLIFHTIRNLAWAYNWDINIEYLNPFEKRYAAL